MKITTMEHTGEDLENRGMGFVKRRVAFPDQLAPKMSPHIILTAESNAERIALTRTFQALEDTLPPYAVRLDEMPIYDKELGEQTGSTLNLFIFTENIE